MEDEQIASEQSDSQNQSDGIDSGFASTSDEHGGGMTGSQDGAKGERQAVSVTRADEERVSIRIKPDVAFGNFQRALQRALDLAALSLQAIPIGEDLPELEDFPFLRFGSQLSLASLQAEYPPWIMGHALTDIIESLEPLIADAIKICRLASLKQAGTFDWNSVNRVLGADLEKDPLGTKLDKLAKEVPGVLTADLQLALKAINKLRVCLTHAGGRVREIDCRPDGRLELSFIFREIFVEYADGTREALQLGMTMKDDGWVIMCRNQEPRVLQPGEKIELTQQDLFRIAATMFELVVRLRANLYTHLRKTFGEDFKEPPVRWNFQIAFSDEPISYKSDEPK